jgi:hypothetical protein
MLLSMSNLLAETQRKISASDLPHIFSAYTHARKNDTIIDVFDIVPGIGHEAIRAVDCMSACHKEKKSCRLQIVDCNFQQSFGVVFN